MNRFAFQSKSDDGATAKKGMGERQSRHGRSQETTGGGHGESDYRQSQVGVRHGRRRLFSEGLPEALRRTKASLISINEAKRCSSPLSLSHFSSSFFV